MNLFYIVFDNEIRLQWKKKFILQIHHQVDSIRTWLQRLESQKLISKSSSKSKKSFSRSCALFEVD